MVNSNLRTPDGEFALRVCRLPLENIWKKGGSIYFDLKFKNTMFRNSRSDGGLISGRTLDGWLIFGEYVKEGRLL